MQNNICDVKNRSRIMDVKHINIHFFDELFYLSRGRQKHRRCIVVEITHYSTKNLIFKQSVSVNTHNSGGSRISPRWGRQHTIFTKISQKLHEIERIWMPRGARVPHASLRSAIAYQCSNIVWTRPQLWVQDFPDMRSNPRDGYQPIIWQNV